MGANRTYRGANTVKIILCHSVYISRDEINNTGVGQQPTRLSLQEHEVPMLFVVADMDYPACTTDAFNQRIWLGVRSERHHRQTRERPKGASARFFGFSICAGVCVGRLSAGAFERGSPLVRVS